MFIWEDEPKDKRSMVILKDTLGNDVRFRKYAGKVFANVLESIKKFSEEDKTRMLENIIYCIPKEWKIDLNKLWMDIEVFEKAQKVFLKYSKKELKKNGWLKWLQNKTTTK